MLNPKSLEKLRPQHARLARLNDLLLVRHAIIGMTLVLVLAATANLAEEHNDVLLPMRQHEKWGFIDRAGHIRISPQFDDAFWINNSFDGELEPVEKGGRWGFINRDGAWVIAPTFYSVTKFHGDIAGVETDEGWTFITSSGSYLRTPDIENVTCDG